MAQLPGTSLRAPVRLYRYQYLLRRLDDDPLEQTFDQSQLALELAPAATPATERPTGGGRELLFLERRSPAGRPHRRGRDRRRTLSR